MRRIVLVLAIPLLVAGLLAAVTAAPANAASKYAALVMDVESGKILFSRHADARRHPASLTKIMTLYMVFDALENGKLSLNQRIPVSARAAGQQCSCLGLRRGDTIRVKDAILALVTKSANDVATAVGEAIGGTEYRFAVAMTEKAKTLGLTSTRFMNASGLHDRRQITTARDMARLAIAIRRDFPGYYKVFSAQSFAYNGRNYTNHNKLLASFDGTDGVKTGYINASGFNLVASVQRNGTRLVGALILGLPREAVRDLVEANAAEEGNSIPAPGAQGRDLVAEGLDGHRRKCCVRALQLLKRKHIGLSELKPCEQSVKPRRD